MGFIDNAKTLTSNMIVSDGKRIRLNIVSGKQYLNLMFSNSVIMYENQNGFVHFTELPNEFFTIKNFDWEGPKYQDVLMTKDTGKSKTKTKAKGGIAGAVIGTMFVPGIGTAVGYALTRGKNETTKHDNQIETVANQSEMLSIATLELENVNTHSIIVLGINCNSQIAIELKNFRGFYNTKSDEAQTKDMSMQQNKIELIKQYKELLDMGVITQEEFNKKKNELFDI